MFATTVRYIPVILAALVSFSNTSLADPADYISAALSADGRPDSDKGRDATRKPADVLAIAKIEPGMHVLDLFSGGGYYAEIMSHIVGETGRVIAHNNPAYLGFVGDALRLRYTEGRLTNVQRPVVEANDLILEASSLDLVTYVLGYHDIYLTADNWTPIDGPKLLQTLYGGLKPGGRLLIIDHTALEGSGHETGTTVHRIAPALVQQEIEAVGFRLEAQSDILSNPDDPLTTSVFDKSIRGKTDRFIMVFVKDEG